MNEVYILTIITEEDEQHPEVRISAYQTMERALQAYGYEVDKAREEAENYAFSHEDSEIATDTYRFYRVEDLHSCNCITIELEPKEIIGDDTEDI